MHLGPLEEIGQPLIRGLVLARKRAPSGHQPPSPLSKQAKKGIAPSKREGYMPLGHLPFETPEGRWCCLIKRHNKNRRIFSGNPSQRCGRISSAAGCVRLIHTAGSVYLFSNSW